MKVILRNISFDSVGTYLPKNEVNLRSLGNEYADGRQTYAVNMYNEIALNCLRIGIKLNTCDGIVWARDGGGREFDGLSEAQATPGTKEALGEIF